MAERRPPLLVGGAPRGGTSLFSKLLVAAGLTTVNDMRRSAKYPQGYFEHVPLLVFHKGMEQFPREHSIHRADYVATTEPFLKPEYLNQPFVRTLHEQAFAPLVNGEVDFLKFPQLALSVDYLFETLGDIRFVAVWRRPAASVRSMAAKEFGRDMTPFRTLRSVLLWNTYAAHVCRAKERHGDRVAVVNIDDVVDGTCTVGGLLRRWGYDVTPPPMESVMEAGVWTPSRREGLGLGIGAVDRLTRLRPAQLGASPDLTDLRAWERRLDAVTDACAA